MKAMMRRVANPCVEAVNFEQMNIMPATQGLTRRTAQLVEGMTNVWYEFVPPCYDGSKPFPLVVQLHGGGHDGRRWAEFTLWHELAKREGLIVVYPDSPEYGCWTCEERDVQYLYDLILRIKATYNIDENRVYMQGMSNGDMMTLAFSLKHTEVLAAAGFATGPSAPEAINGDKPVGALPVIQMRGELDINWGITPETQDVYATRYTMNDDNRALWEEVNGIKAVLPTLTLRGKDNFLFYQGTAAPLLQWEVQGMSHREPANGAPVFWDTLYSGATLQQGKHIAEGFNTPLPGDDDTIILALGSTMAYRKNGIVPLSALHKAAVRVFTPASAPHFAPVKLNEMGEQDFIAAPVDFFAALYGAKVTLSASGDEADVLFPDGRTLHLSANALVIKVNNEYRALQKPCIARGGVLFMPVGELCAMLFNAHISQADDVLCISGHYAVLGRYTASILRKLLGGTMRPRVRPQNW